MTEFRMEWMNGSANEYWSGFANNHASYLIWLSCSSICGTVWRRMEMPSSMHAMLWCFILAAHMVKESRRHQCSAWFLWVSPSHLMMRSDAGMWRHCFTKLHIVRQWIDAIASAAAGVPRVIFCDIAADGIFYGVTFLPTTLNVMKCRQHSFNFFGLR